MSYTSGIEFEMTRPTEGLSTILPAIGEFFSSDLVYLGPMSKYATWHLKLLPTSGEEEIPCKICFRYLQSTTAWALIINGDVKAAAPGKLSDAKVFDIAFKLSGQYFTINSLVENNTKFTVLLRMNGEEASDSKSMADIDLGETVIKQIRITGTRSYDDKYGKRVTVYTVSSTIDNGPDVEVEQRYSAFEALDSMIRGQIPHHLRTIMPSLPGKVLNPFTDQNSPDFIEQRRNKLQSYLDLILGNDKIKHLSDLACFLGRHPITGHGLQLPAADV